MLLGCGSEAFGIKKSRGLESIGDPLDREISRFGGPGEPLELEISRFGGPGRSLDREISRFGVPGGSLEREISRFGACQQHPSISSSIPVASQQHLKKNEVANGIDLRES